MSQRRTVRAIWIGAGMLILGGSLWASPPLPEPDAYGEPGPVAQKAVMRLDLSTDFGPIIPPHGELKPFPETGGGPETLGGPHLGESGPSQLTSAVAVAASSPQQRLESRMKALARDLR